MTFAVMFDPELPDHGSINPPKKVSWTVAYGSANGQPEHDLRYVICGEVIGYYPASLATLLVDLLGELDALQQGRDHGVSMSGYTVLWAEMSADNVTFRDPGPAAEMVGVVPLADVQAALQAAIARLWACLTASSPTTA